MIAILAFLAAIPLWAPHYWILFTFLCFVYVAICEMWGMLAGLAGMVLLGIYGLIGFAAYTFVIYSTLLHLPIWVSLLLAGFTTVILMLVLAPSIFKMRGLYFAVCSLVVAEAISAWFKTWPYTRAGAGIGIYAQIPLSTLYYVAFALALISFFAAKVVARSKTGLALKAIGDDEDAAQCVGINSYRVKLYCMLFASFIIGIAGATYFLYPLFVTPTSAFSYSWLVNTITASAFGGLRSVEGVIIGVIVVIFLQQFFYVNYAGFSLLIGGLTIIIILLAAPEGILAKILRILKQR